MNSLHSLHLCRVMNFWWSTRNIDSTCWHQFTLEIANPGYSRTFIAWLCSQIWTLNYLQVSFQSMHYSTSTAEWNFTFETPLVHYSKPLEVCLHYAAWSNAALSYGKSCSAYAAKLISSTLKKNFFWLYFSSQKLCMRNLYASYAEPKIASRYSWRQMLARQTVDEIIFSCCTAFCSMLQRAETVPKSCCNDVYTIFGICCVAKPHFITFAKGHSMDAPL